MAATEPSTTPGTNRDAVRASRSISSWIGRVSVGSSVETVVEKTCQISVPGSVSRPWAIASSARRCLLSARSSTMA